jgi:multidrug efflux pump subunit AcrA (membrane-fusion protein)
MFKKKSFWIVLAAIVLLGAGGYYYYTTQMVQAEAADSQESTMQTAVSRQGDLVVFASGAGQVVPSSETGLGFEESGTLVELNVIEGGQVAEGDIIARLQTKESEESIQASITDAELAVVKAEQALDDLYNNAEIERTNALAGVNQYSGEVRDAQYALDNYIMPIYLQGLDTVEAMDLMREQLDQAVAAFEPYKYLSSNNSTRQSFLEDLNDAQANYNAAVQRLEYEYALEVAEANLDKARSEYEKYKDGPAQDEIELAEAELANAQAKLELARDTQAVLELITPADGTVLEVTASVGEQIGTEPIVIIADLEQPTLEVYLDETDLDKVSLGYEADVVFDALPDNTYQGEVVSVSPGLEDVSGVQAVKALVKLDGDALIGSIYFPVGLNASVDIIAGRVEGAVLVPIEALRELDPGEYAVFVVEDGEPKMRVVQVGLMDVTSAEIISGLKAGQVISTGIVQTQ